MKNHYKPNIKSTQNKTLENPFGKIQINSKPKPPLPWNACRCHERESVSVLRHGGLVESFFILFYFFSRFEESTDLIERNEERKRKKNEKE